MIDGNRLVEALSLPSHDKRVIELLKELGFKRPMKDENYDGVAIIYRDENEYFQIDFDEDIETDKQKNNDYGIVDFYLNIISFRKNDIFTPPFGIEWSDGYEEVKAILDKKADYKDSKRCKKTWILEDTEKKYILNIQFNLDYNSIKKITLLPFNSERKYTLEKNED